VKAYPVAAALIAATAVGAACGSRATPPGRTVRIAAAADLRFALDDLTGAFKRTHGDIDLAVSYGSSGSFFAQLLNRAPFDVFLSADVAYPRQLTERGLTVPGSEFAYAAGHIVLWTPAASGLDVGRAGISALVDARVRHVAIPNPEHAPYGRAAEAAMRSAGIFDQVAPKLVFGENASQALQFVQSGAAEVGIVPMALALSPAVQRDGKFFEIPAASYPRIEQGGVILSWAADPGAAQQFRSFMTGAEARAVLERYGFSVPGA
jgi:molybdate transport system substrate-binding protein